MRLQDFRKEFLRTYFCPNSLCVILHVCEESHFYYFICGSRQTLSSLGGGGGGAKFKKRLFFPKYNVLKAYSMGFYQKLTFVKRIAIVVSEI